MNEPFMNLLFNNMRARSERLGDFNMVGTSRKAEEHLQRLYKQFGDGLLSGVEELIDRSERQLRAKMSNVRMAIISKGISKATVPIPIRWWSN